MEIKKNHFGTTSKGEEVTLYTLKNSNGISLDIISYGGIITNINFPDKNGCFSNIVLGYDNWFQSQVHHHLVLEVLIDDGDPSCIGEEVVINMQSQKLKFYFIDTK